MVKHIHVGPEQSVRRVIRRQLQADRRPRNFVRTNEAEAEYRVITPTESFFIGTQADAMARHRARQRECMRTRHTLIKYYTDPDSFTYPASETLQPSAPHAMRVRSVINSQGQTRLCVFAGAWTRERFNALEDDVQKGIVEAAEEAAALERKGYRVGQVTPNVFWELKDKHKLSGETLQILEANMRHGIPLRTAVRHVLRARLGEVTEQQVHNRVTSIRRVLRRRQIPRCSTPVGDVGHPTGCSEYTLEAAASPQAAD